MTNLFDLGSLAVTRHMLGFPWLALRQAQEALKNERLEEAHRILCQPCAQGHKGSWEILQQLARGFVERGERHLQHEDPTAAWNDLLLAEQVGAVDSVASRLRYALTRLGLAEVRTLLAAGETTRAGEVIVLLRNRAVRHPELERLDEVAKSWSQARDLANRGEFAQSLQEMERVRRLWSETPTVVDQFCKDLEQRQQSFSGLVVRLHDAVQRQAWQEVLQLSEQVLAQAPHHEEARKARSRAWKAIEPVTVAAEPRKKEAAKSDPVPGPSQQRFLLWIDGIGGYLVCLGNRVTIGQATPEAYVDIPLFADVSRLHANLTRDSEGYLLEAVRSAQVNGKPVEKVLLQAEDRITLGSCCQMHFRQPVPVSASARLDIVSGHRLPLAVDGVLLMADTLVLGPGTHVHVSVPDLEQPVILFRQKDGLGVRCAGSFTINGQRLSDRGSLGMAATMTGEDFALAVEPLGTRMGRT